MTENELSELLSTPAFLRKVLNNFQGPFSLGIAGPDKIILSVEKTAHQFPSVVEAAGQFILVEVDRAWRQPAPYSQSLGARLDPPPGPCRNVIRRKDDKQEVPLILEVKSPSREDLEHAIHMYGGAVSEDIDTAWDVISKMLDILYTRLEEVEEEFP